MRPIQSPAVSSGGVPGNAHLRRTSRITIPNCPPVCAHENRLLNFGSGKLEQHPLSIFRFRNGDLNRDHEMARAAILKILKDDTAHFQDCHVRQIQPSSDRSGIRMIRSLPSILAALNANLGTNLVYCETQHEFGALLDSIIRKGGEWRGGAVVWMHGDLSKYFNNEFMHHVIGVNILNRNGVTIMEAFDSLPELARGYRVAFEKFEEVVNAREGIFATYASLPVQAANITCGIHAIHAVLAEYDTFRERAELLAGKYHLSSQWSSVVGGRPPKLPSLMTHVETEKLLFDLEWKMFQRLPHTMSRHGRSTASAASTSSTSSDKAIAHVCEHLKTHLTKKPTEDKANTYEYSDSIEKYMLTLLEGAVHWMDKADAPVVVRGLGKVRPHNLGNSAIRALENSLLMEPARTLFPTFRILPPHVNSPAAPYWNPERHLENANLPVAPTAALIRQRQQG